MKRGRRFSGFLYDIERLLLLLTLFFSGEPLAEKGEVAGERAVDRASSSRIEEAAAEEVDGSEGGQAVGTSECNKENL